MTTIIPTNPDNNTIQLIDFYDDKHGGFYAFVGGVSIAYSMMRRDHHETHFLFPSSNDNNNYSDVNAAKQAVRSFWDSFIAQVSFPNVHRTVVENQ